MPSLASHGAPLHSFHWKTSHTPMIYSSPWGKGCGGCSTALGAALWLPAGARGTEPYIQHPPEGFQLVSAALLGDPGWGQGSGMSFSRSCPGIAREGFSAHSSMSGPGPTVWPCIYCLGIVGPEPDSLRSNPGLATTCYIFVDMSLHFSDVVSSLEIMVAATL